jgi:acetate kinase
LAWLGVHLNRAANHASDACISAADSDVDVLVMATDEEAMIAHHVWDQLLMRTIAVKNAGARGLNHSEN